MHAVETVVLQLGTLVHLSWWFECTHNDDADPFTGGLGDSLVELVLRSVSVDRNRSSGELSRPISLDDARLLQPKPEVLKHMAVSEFLLSHAAIPVLRSFLAENFKYVCQHTFDNLKDSDSPS